MSTEQKGWPLVTEASPETRERAVAEFADAQIALGQPRGLMQSLRRIMESADTADTKLNGILALVGRELRADICSCFVLRAGEVIELYATYGLPDEVVRQKKLRLGEGVVGEMAATAMPAIVPDVTKHPAFMARPETGNGEYKAICGVPILRGGRVHGMLILQNRHERGYGDEVIDILQTVAIVLAELIVTGGILTRQEMNSGYAAGGKPSQVTGASLARGLAVGTVVFYEPGVSMRDIIADDTKAEKARLSQGLASMHDAIDQMLSANATLSSAESRDILEAYKMFARDRGWLTRIEAAIDKGLTAEAAVQRVQNETRVRMMQVTDSYIRERMQDMEDLSNRLLTHLTKKDKARSEPLQDNIILVARSMGPAALLDYDHSRLKGVILERGSHSNHVAIVARSLGIPVVGQCVDILNFVTDGDPAIVDGDNGVVYIHPSDYIVDLYSKSIETRARRSTLYRRQAQQESVTKNGVRVNVMMNAGLVTEMDAMQSVGAEGIGLFRTELSFMTWQKYPSVATQAELYGRIMDKAAGKPVVFRTLDIGGDKPLPYFNAPDDEDNPALGWRALRIAMDRPAVLRTQLRAMIKGAQGRPLKIMFPFVTELAELDHARHMLDLEKRRAITRGQSLPEKIEMGVMLEVPSLLFQLEGLLKTVDFVSVGTNDLMQYLYAADRGNFAVRKRYDPLSPALLKVLRSIADRCRAARVPVSVCGEMAGHPLDAMVLIALGFDTLSASAQGIESVKSMIPTLDTSKLMPYLEQLLDSREHSLRERLLSFARDHKINIMQTN